jgi:hypothetical protein
MLTRTQALEGGANVTCISKVQFTYRSIHPVNHFWPLRYSQGGVAPAPWIEINGD